MFRTGRRVALASTTPCTGRRVVSSSIGRSGGAADADARPAPRLLSTLVGQPGTRLADRYQSRRTESTLTAVAGQEFVDVDEQHRTDSNDHDTWYELTRTAPDFDRRDDDCVADRTPSTVSPRAATTVDEAKRFEDMPGPRGLPLIGNVLSYSKFGECVY